MAAPRDSFFSIQIGWNLRRLTAEWSFLEIACESIATT